MSKTPIALALVGGVAVGFLIGRSTAGDAEPVRDEAASDLTARVAELEADVRQARAAKRDAESALREAERREKVAVEQVAAAEAARDAALAAVPAADADGGGEAAAESASFPSFTPRGLDEKAFAALAETDFETIGGHMAAMSPALVELSNATQAGTDPPPDAIAAIQTNNMPLAMAAVRLMAAGVPGTGANGAFTHPGFMINSMAATLESAGLPLSDAQKLRFAAIGNDFVKRENTRLASYEEDALPVRKLIDETVLKREMVDALRNELTGEQVETLSPADVRDRVGMDLFSAGILWVQRMDRVRHTSRDDLISALERKLLGSVPEAERAPARNEIQAWVDGLPHEFLEHASDPAERRGWPTLDRLQACAGHVTALLESLLERGNLPEALTVGLRQSQGTLMLDRPAPE